MVRGTDMQIAATELGAERSPIIFDRNRSPQPRVPPRTNVDRASRADSFIATLTFAGIAAHLVLRYGFKTSSLTQLVPLYVTLILGGLPLIVRLTGKIFARELM